MVGINELQSLLPIWFPSDLGGYKSTMNSADDILGTFKLQKKEENVILRAWLQLL